MFKIQEEILSLSNKKIRIDTNKCNYISPTCLIILASLFLIKEDNELNLRLTHGSQLMKQLETSGFIFDTNTDKRSIPLNIIKSEKDAYDNIVKLIKRSPLKELPEEDKNVLISKLYEIPINALSHSESIHGIISIGYYNNSKTFMFSVYDLGIGIPNSVRKFLNEKDMSPTDALNWALKDGNSTRKADYRGGAGLTVLEMFRRKTKGKITLITEDIMYISQNGQNSSKLRKTISGTLFTFKIMI